MNATALPPRAGFPFRSGIANAFAIWALATLVLGVGCFVLAGEWLQRLSDRLWAAVYWQIAFALGLTFVLAVVYHALRKTGRTLRDIGWRAPCPRPMLAAGVLLGLLYTAGVYAGIANDPAMRGVNPFSPHWLRFVLAPLGIYMAFCEEAVMRGYFMSELARARVGTASQILLSGACSAVYHSLHNPTPLGYFPSFALFSIHAGMYVAAKRSLTPTTVAHSLYHVLGAPYLLMFAMSQMH